MDDDDDSFSLRQRKKKGKSEFFSAPPATASFDADSVIMGIRHERALSMEQKVLVKALLGAADAYPELTTAGCALYSREMGPVKSCL